MKLDLMNTLTRRWIRVAIWAMVGVLSVLRFFYLTADFPNDSLWMIDQAKFTDEGWWCGAAVMHALTGHWYVAGDYNPAVALPVWPLLVGAVFHFTGVSVVAARALNVAISISTLGILFALVRRYTETETPALLAVLLLAASPFAFVFSRLAILDTLVVFEFCVLMLMASYASRTRLWMLASLAVLISAMILTKTTAVLLVPAIGWMAWSAMERKTSVLLPVGIATAVLPALLLKSYALLVSALGYGTDYEYFFNVNAMPDIDWRQTVATLFQLLQSGFWIDRVLFPVGLTILVVTVGWKRKLWSNPLFAAAWIAIAAQAVFIFRQQDNYAPRYFLVMLSPLIVIVALTYDQLMTHSRKMSAVLVVAMAGSVIANVVMVGQFLTNRDYDFHNAADAIGAVIRSHPEQKALIVGVSGNQLSLMTGIPSINDGYGTEDMAEKVARYQPGWYVAWNDVTQEDHGYLSVYKLEKVASYPAFDDDDRGALTLYKLVKKADGSPDAFKASGSAGDR